MFQGVVNLSARKIDILSNNLRAMSPVAVVFSIFLAIRIIARFFLIRIFTIYGDAYAYYVPAGIAYIKGTLPIAVNPEHPPLAKYIIGFFAVYIHDPNLASILISFFSAITAYLLARRLTVKSSWAVITVWLLTFDLINISISIHPMLDVFMLFFALLGLYLIVVARWKGYYALAGVMLGFAFASKWVAAFFVLPALIFIVWRRKYLEASIMLATGMGAYILTYLPLITAKGFEFFISHQVWMMQFMLKAHSSEINTVSIASSFIVPFIFQTTTFGQVSDYDRLLHPEGFQFLGRNYISFADVTNPLIIILSYPLLYFQMRKYFFDREPARLFMLLLLLSLYAWLILLGNSLELWFYAPVTAVLSIFAADSFSDLYGRGKTGKKLTYLYLALVAMWIIYANVIQVLRIVHYKGII